MNPSPAIPLPLYSTPFPWAVRMSPAQPCWPEHPHKYLHSKAPEANLRLRMKLETIVVKSTIFRISQTCFLGVWLLALCLPSARLSFLLCSMGAMLSQGLMEIQYDNAGEGPALTRSCSGCHQTWYYTPHLALLGVGHFCLSVAGASW